MNQPRPAHLDPETTGSRPVVVPTPRTASGADPVEVTDARFTPNPLRRRAADRLALAGRRHVRHWTDLAGASRRPGLHALVFVHHEPTAKSAAGSVRIAGRMFLHGDDVTDLHTILTEIRERAREYCDAGVHHPIAQLADTAEPMTRSAYYIGIGTSSIEPERYDGPGSWPWRGLLHLADNTRMIIRGSSSVQTPDLQTTHTLDPAAHPTGGLHAFHPGRAWRWTSPDLDLTDPRLVAHMDALAALHALIQAGETEPRRHRRGATHHAG